MSSWVAGAFQGGSLVRWRIACWCASRINRRSQDGDKKKQSTHLHCKTGE